MAIYNDELQRIKKEHLISGPWNEDFKKYPAVKYQFTYKNYDCAIKRNPFWAWCGYIKIPTTHHYHNKSFDDIDIDVHGGFTGGDNEDRIGFDTCHAGDMWPTTFYESDLGDHYWTYEETIEEVKKIVDQLIEKEN